MTEYQFFVVAKEIDGERRYRGMLAMWTPSIQFAVWHSDRAAAERESSPYRGEVVVGMRVLEEISEPVKP